MTKDTPEDCTDTGTTSGDKTTTEAVPEDAEWTLVEQSPVDPEEGGGLSVTIIEAVAEAEGIAPKHLKHPPLFDVVDTAALEEAFFGTHSTERAHDPNTSTEFMYRDYRVVVRSDGWVQVYEGAAE